MRSPEYLSDSQREINHIKNRSLSKLKDFAYPLRISIFRGVAAQIAKEIEIIRNLERFLIDNERSLSAPASQPIIQIDLSNLDYLRDGSGEHINPHI